LVWEFEDVFANQKTGTLMKLDRPPFEVSLNREWKDLPAIRTKGNFKISPAKRGALSAYVAEWEKQGLIEEISVSQARWTTPLFCVPQE
jgi:hypothetical protein